MKKSPGFMIAIAALFIFLAWTGQVQGYEVRGDVTPGWGTSGGNLWYDVLKETATSTEGGYDDAATPPVYGVLVRPPTTKDFPNLINPTNHNWVEVDYILVTGADGHRALYSVGELDPRFGNGTVTITCSGSAKNNRSCNRGYHCDLAGLGRSVRNVSTIDAIHAFTHMKGVTVDGAKDVHPFSPMLIVSGEGVTPKTYNLAALQALPQVIFDASASTANTVGIWHGPRLVDVLKDAGVDTKDMNSYIIVQATDGYAAVLSMYEATQLTGAQYALLGISDTLNNTLNNGTCTDAVSANTTCKDGGFVRLVLPKDLAAGRWTSNTSQIIVYKLHSRGYRW